MTPSSPHPSDSRKAYQQAGVSLSQADAAVAAAKHHAERTHLPQIPLAGIGGFSGAFQVPPGYRNPVLLAATDGVGTKLELAQQFGQLKGIGVDLVAMSVNDLLTQGGKPLAFLDYYATGQLDVAAFEEVIAGIAEGCRQSGCALIGGETAEMPGFYGEGQFDLAGFALGVVEAEQMLPNMAELKAGDVILGLASSGVHANGYSLVRHLIKEKKLDPQSSLSDGVTMIEALLAPTRLYVKPVLKTLSAHPNAIKAMVHITGGGFQENIPRVLPKTLNAEIDLNQWMMPPVFEAIAKAGELDSMSMLNTFNCGIGFVCVVNAVEAQAITETLMAQGERVFNLGQLLEAPEANEKAELHFKV